jgi:hypothetical protein
LLHREEERLAEKEAKEKYLQQKITERKVREGRAMLALYGINADEVIMKNEESGAEKRGPVEGPAVLEQIERLLRELGGSREKWRVAEGLGFVFGGFFFVKVWTLTV